MKYGELIFRSGQDPISIIDVETGRFLDVNGAWERLYGYARDEAVGHMGPRDVSAEAALTDAAISRVRTGEPVCRHLRLHRSRSGAVFPVEIHAGSYVLDGKSVMVAMIRDVSERVRLESQLRQADRMASVGALAAAVAHEINNPLSWVTAHLEHLAVSLRPGAPLEAADLQALADVVDEARDGVRRVRQIAGDLKAFSRPGDDGITAVDVAEAMRAALRMVSNRIRHQAQLTVELCPGLKVHANEARLGQVFLNLLGNALEALPDRPYEENRISLVVREGSAGHVWVEISDNGRGIPEALQPHVFQPFFTTRAADGGTGLGLSICHGIVAALGGRMELESRPGEGTTFRVLLPRLTAVSASGGTERAQPAGAEAGPDAVSDDPLRVLLVDDERNLGRALERALEPEVSLQFVTDAREALDRIARGERYDAVICDLMMPSMNGMDFYDALCRLHPALAARTGFVTGGTFTTPAREFALKMRDRVIEKPFLASDLHALVRRMSRAEPAPLSSAQAP